MPRRSDSKQRMLETAAELLRSRGYHATGLNEIVSASGAPKGSLYFHFPGGKEQLASEALRLSSERLCEQLSAALGQGSGPGTEVEAIIGLLADALRESDFRHGCPLATVALDAAEDSEPIREACVNGYRTWHALFVGALTTHNVAEERATQLGTVILASLEGALLLAKTQRDTAPLRAVATHLRNTIEQEATR